MNTGRGRRPVWSSPAPPSPSLLHNRAYVLLWTAHTLSSLGSLGTAVALPLYVLTVLGSPSAAALIGIAEAAGMALALPVGGMLVDRWGWRAVMLGADLIQAVALAGLTITIASGQARLGVIFSTCVVLSVTAVPFHSAAIIALRFAVPTAQIPQALAAIHTRAAAVAVLGPLAGASLYGQSSTLPFAVDAASFVCSLLCLAALPHHTATTTPKPTPGVRLEELVAGWRFFGADPFLRLMLINATVVEFVLKSVLLMLMVSVVATDGSLASGIVVAAAGIGNLAGAVLAVRAQRRLGPRVVIRTALAALAVTVLLMAAQMSLWWIALLLACCCVTTPPAQIVVNQHLLRVTPTDVLGRVQVVYQAAPRLIGSAGPLCAAGLLTLFPVRLVLLLMGAVLAVLAVVNTAAPQRIPFWRRP